jgi:hypothetical protein
MSHYNPYAATGILTAIIAVTENFTVHIFIKIYK